MKEKLYLIDGHALIFKMYYAFLRRPMINSKGADMSILFGFTKYLLELISKENPSYLAVAFDPPGGTFRNKLYPAYKATRAATPQLVIDSLAPLVELCGAMNIATLLVPGFEADDVIGSMAKREAKAGKEVYMVTPDKDYGQLVQDNIYQVKPGKAGGEDEVLDSKAICEKYGISVPSQVIEMLTLCGDTADNVPGVKGIGEVGAGKLISRYGTVENIYRHIDELTSRQQEQFREAEPHIALSHELVTIKTDMVLDTSEEDMKVNLSFGEKLADLFEKYEFNSLMKYLPKSEPGQGTEALAEKNNICIGHSTVEDFIRKAEKNAEVSVSIETDGPGIFAGIRKVTLATKDSDSEIVTVSSGDVEGFRDILENKGIGKYGQDLKYQANVLSYNGIRLDGLLFDIGLMHYLIDPEKSHRLDILSKSYLGVEIDGQEETPEPVSLFDTPVSDSTEDRLVAIILLVGKKVRNEMEKVSVDSLYYNMEEPLMLVLSKMERAGVKVDLNQLNIFANSLRKEMTEREARVREMAGEPDLNVSSPKQVGEVIFGKLRLDPKAKKTSKGSYPTDETTLSSLSDKSPIINEILEFRAVRKLLSTYIEPFPSYVSNITGRVHTTFNQALTATGRLSSSNPNLQNIPVRTDRGKEIRKAFVGGTPEMYIVSADYSQIELRIMAHLSQDQHLIQAFRNGIDIHSATAEKIFGVPHDQVTPEQRRVAKTANFGIMYGISSFGLSQRLGISRTEAKKLIDDYFNAFPAIRSFIDDTLTFAREKGYVETLFGRRRYLPDINAKNATVRSLAERNAVNAPIQGTAADIIKLAMINVDREIAGMKSKMVLQIHDELLFDVVEDELQELMSIVKSKMENVIELSVPLTVECNYGKNWLEAH